MIIFVYLQIIYLYIYIFIAGGNSRYFIEKEIFMDVLCSQGYTIETTKC